MRSTSEEQNRFNPSLVATENRTFARQTGITVHTPVSCVFRYGEQRIEATVVNYHFEGACLRISKDETRVLDPEVTLDFYLGKVCIRAQMRFKICWQEVSTTGLLGIQFTESLKKYIRKEERVQTNELYPPTVVGTDPINPIRQVFFRVADFSQTGMLLVTSATNNTLFPGMIVEQCQLSVPGREIIPISLFIESIRPGPSAETIHVGASVQTQSKAFLEVISEYALYLSPTGFDSDDRLEELIVKRKMHSKLLKVGLTYRVINIASDYEKVLKLRHLGYGKAGKIKVNKTWKDMGEGLKDEGTILGAFLGSQLVGSVEIREGKQMTLRTANQLSTDQLSTLNLDRIIEPNRLVVHPKAQGSDVVIGLIQRIHAMAVLQGSLDVLLLATDKLVPFYKKMGIRDLAMKIPHPVVPDQNLNLMLAEASMYEKGIGLNPYFWSQIWEVTHEYLQELGLVDPVRNTIFRRFRWLIGRGIWALAQTRKKSPHRKIGTSIRHQTDQRFIDPKWTTQHLSAHVLMPYLLKAEEIIGRPAVASLLSSIGVPREYFFHQSNWFSMSFFDRFIEEYKGAGDVQLLQRESGRKSMDKEVLGFTYYFLKHFAGMEALLRSFGKVAMRFNTTRTYEVIHLRPGRGTIKIGCSDTRLLPQDPSACLNWIGNFEGGIELTTGKKGAVKKLACCFQGDEACVYELQWEQKRTIRNALLKWAPIVFGVLAIPALSLVPHYYAWALQTKIMLYGIILTLLLAYLKELLKYKSLTQQFENYHQESNSRYNDLQKSKSILDQNYKEATLLEELTKNIQRSDHLTNILNTTVAAVCEKFGFSRAFIMLLDRDTFTLRTTAVAGTREHSDLLWNFSVDVSKVRDNPMVLSSVFRTGQSVLIDEVNAYKFHLNPESQNMIEKLKTSGFIIVPIPALEGNWGVMVADKAITEAKLERRDLVMLQRVSQHLGVALDKKSKLEQEERLRLMFQKYVPSRVINGSLNSEEPVLGGKTRDITCMFVDIREFTKLSQTYPSEVILDVLNRFFSLIQIVAGKHDGTIDKFLGDGVLVTWGTTGEQYSHTILATNAALEILQKLCDLNKQLQDSSLPQISIGIGINTGPALVGNIGSQERMEFTAIGPTVNLASRLEGLCKVYNTKGVISESVLTKLDPANLKRWKVLENVQVRGISHLVRIGVLDLTNNEELI